MALNIKKIKDESTLVTSPIFSGRNKGSWDGLQETEQTVIETTVYTDSHGDTYGVMVFKSAPDEFFLCGKVASNIAALVCDRENGAEFDDNGVMILPYKIKIGVKTKAKGDPTKTYLPVEFIG